MAIARIAAIRWFFDPIISVGFPMPKIAFLPVVILWLGVFDVSKISMVVFDAIFPVVTATDHRAAGRRPRAVVVGAQHGRQGAANFWQISFPAALPQIFTGLQVALPIALIVAIVTEMLMGGYGLGGAMMQRRALPIRAACSPASSRSPSSAMCWSS